MNYSTQGYKTNSPDRNNPYNVINSKVIGTDNMATSITAIPIINGKPDYSKRQVLHPNQGDFVFEGAEAVLELPYAQVGLTTGLGATLTNGFLPNFNFNTSVIPQTTAPANPIDNSGTVGNMDFNFYTGVEQGSVLPQALNNPIAQQSNLQIQQNNLDYGRQVDLYQNQYSQPDPIQRQIYSTQEQLRQQMGIQDPLQSQTDYNNSVKSIQDKSTTPNKEQTGSWWDFANGLTRNLDRSYDVDSSVEMLGYMTGLDFNNNESMSEQQRKIGNTGKIFGIAGSAGRALLGTAKNFFEGRAAANREQQAINEYHENMSNRMRDRNTYYATYQKGGQIQDEKILTGGYTTGIPENAPITPTAEVERNEFLLQNDGSVQQVLGNTHEQGGELMDLEAGTRVISDHLKIGGEFSKRLNKDFDLNTRAKETYAKAVEKYRKKIGLQKVLDEYQEVIGKIKDQEETEHTQTREINLSFLAQRVQELEAQKAPLEEELSKFTEFVFQEQESKKEETQPTSSYQDGGEVEQILQSYSQVTGIPFEQLLQEFNSLSEQEQQILLQEILQELQGSQQQQQQTDPEQLIQAYAQATGTDPNQILQQLQQMSPEKQQQALAQIEQELQQPQQQYRKGGNVPKYQEGNETLPILPNNIYGFGLPNFTFSPPESMLTTTTTQPPVTTTNTAITGVVPRTQFDEYQTNYSWEPTYGYRELSPTQQRLKYLYDLYNIEYNPEDFNRDWTRQELDEGFGRMQEVVNRDYAGVAGHYMSTRSNTKQDIDFYLDRGLITQDFLKSQGVELDANGKARLGIKEQQLDRSVDDAIYAEVQKNAEEKGLEQDLIDYRQVGFRDNKSYYRAPELHRVEFESQEDFEKYLQDNGYGEHIDEIGGQKIYYTNKEGLYFTPIIKEQPTTTEETTPTTGTTTNPYTATQNKTAGYRGLNHFSFDPGMSTLRLSRNQSLSPPHLQHIEESPEPVINEINRQVTFANQMTNYAPDSTRGAQTANNLALGIQGVNQAVPMYNFQNAFRRQQAEQSNDLQVVAADRMNTELASNYERQILTALGNWDAERLGRDYFLYRQEAQQRGDDFKYNIAQSMFPNMRLNPDGTITGIGSPIEIYQNLLNQQQQKGKTQISQKGGTIKDHLKLTMFKNKK